MSSAVPHRWTHDGGALLPDQPDNQGSSSRVHLQQQLVVPQCLNSLKHLHWQVIESNE
jgi:hypothetical protein